MTSRLGCHWIRVHPDGRDLAHIEAMQYPSAKLFEWHWSNRDACADLLSVLPKDAYILARDHPLSEQEIWSDPVGIGTRQANEWAMKVAGGNYHLPVERTFFLGRNEPDATSGDRNAIDIYTEAFLDRLRVHGLRGGAFNFSTGHPRTVDGSSRTLADYAVFERSHQAISRGHHIGVLHIYGTAAVPCAPGHYDRLRACPWMDVEWVVGECGIDQHVIGGGPHDGYLRVLGNPADYCRWLDEFIMGVNDKRIHSYQVFSYDYSHPWSQFDTRTIRDALESYDWQHVKQPPIAIVGDGPTPPPKITPVTGQQFVVTATQANLRTAPSLLAQVIAVLPAGTPLDIIGFTEEWYQIDRWDGQGAAWIHKSVGQVDKPQPTPEPVDDVGKRWSRTIAFVLKEEGGLSTDPNDPGNYVNGVFVGTHFGISANAHPNVDIVNLTVEQAKEIYKNSYWIPSGASQAGWPLCLAIMDLSVNGGVGRAKEALNETGRDFVKLMAWRIDWYTRIQNFDRYGVAWIRRCSRLMMEANK